MMKIRLPINEEVLDRLRERRKKEAGTGGSWEARGEKKGKARQRREKVASNQS